MRNIANAADFTIQLQPASNSVSDPQVSSISNTKVDGLGSLATKSTITNSEVSDGALSSSKILNFANDVLSSLSSTLSNYVLKSDQVAVRISAPTQQITNATWTIASFTQSNATMNTSMAATANRVIVPKAGNYEIKMKASSAGTSISTWVGTAYKINGGPQVVLAQLAAGSGNYPVVNTSDIVSLNANDYIEFFIIGTGTDGITVGGTSVLSQLIF